MTEGKDVGFFFEKPQEGDKRPQVLKEIIQGKTIELLEQKGWGVCVATLGLENPELARNMALAIKETFSGHPNVPLVMWVVLPEKDGYWTDPLYNLKQTKERITQVERWVNDYQLPVTGMGLDIEPEKKQSVELYGKGVGIGNRLLLLRRRNLELKRAERLYQLEKMGENPSQELADLIGDLKFKNMHPEAYIAPAPIPKIVSLVYPQGAEVYAMTYTCGMSDFVSKLALKGWLKIPGGLKKDEHLAFGAIQGTGTSSGTDIESNIIPGYATTRELKRDIQTAKSLGGDLSSFRVFALIGPEIVQATMDALETKPGQ